MVLPIASGRVVQCAQLLPGYERRHTPASDFVASRLGPLVASTFPEEEFFEAFDARVLTKISPVGHQVVHSFAPAASRQQITVYCGAMERGLADCLREDRLPSSSVVRCVTSPCLSVVLRQDVACRSFRGRHLTARR